MLFNNTTNTTNATNAIQKSCFRIILGDVVFLSFMRFFRRSFLIFHEIFSISFVTIVDTFPLYCSIHQLHGFRNKSGGKMAERSKAPL